VYIVIVLMLPTEANKDNNNIVTIYSKPEKITIQSKLTGIR